MVMNKLLLGTIAVVAVTTQANAAPIAQCVLKSYAEVKASPSASSHVVLSMPDELRVDVLEEFGTQWVWVASTDSDHPTKVWVRRSSLKFCLERGTVPKVKPQFWVASVESSRRAARAVRLLWPGRT
jgi:hypothetical protein